jgi:hypothetical protein
VDYVHGFIFGGVAEDETDVEVEFAPTVGDPAEGRDAEFNYSGEWKGFVEEDCYGGKKCGDRGGLFVRKGELKGAGYICG